MGTTLVTCESSPLESGQVLYAYFTITVTGDCPDPCLIVQRPADLIVPCDGPRGSIVYFNVAAENSCMAERVTVICDPPSGSLFPPGESEVRCVASSAGRTNEFRFRVSVTGECTPRIQISRLDGDQMEISWPALADEFRLEESDALGDTGRISAKRSDSLAGSPRPAAPGSNWRVSTLPILRDRDRNRVALTAGLLGPTFYRSQNVPTIGATFVRQSVPTSVYAAGEYTVSITMRNTGTVSWTQDPEGRFHGLGSLEPVNNRLWRPNRVYASRPEVAPGTEVTFEFPIRAPTVPGTYAFQWRMVENDSYWFGAPTPRTEITVRSFPRFTCIGPANEFLDPPLFGLRGTPAVALNQDGKLQVFAYLATSRLRAAPLHYTAIAVTIATAAQQLAGSDEYEWKRTMGVGYFDRGPLNSPAIVRLRFRHS